VTDLDLSQKSARVGDVHVSIGEGQRARIDITWKPQHKQLVGDYAQTKGWSFSHLVERIIEEHAAKQAKKHGWKWKKNVREIIDRLRRSMPRSTFIRGLVLDHIDKHPLRTLPPPPKESDLSKLKETRPDALVYVLPVVGSRIVTAPDGEGGWRGIVFDPTIIGSTTTWHSTHLNPPVWAKTPSVLKALAFVASRIDMDGMAWFAIPMTSIKVAAEWVPYSKRFERGEVVDTKTGYKQIWQRGGWYSSMPDPKGAFNLRPNVRRMLNMLCRTMTVGNGGIEAHVPSH
jgi:hypothetical protein